MIIYYSDKQIAQKFGVNKSTIWRWVREKKFPTPVILSARCTRWESSEVEQWIVERKNKTRKR